MVLRVDLIVQCLRFVVHAFHSVDDLAQFSSQPLLLLRDLVERGDLLLLALINALFVLANGVQLVLQSFTDAREHFANIVAE